MADDMECALSCSICMELYDEPVLLPCLHSLCKSCLEQLKRPSKKVQCPQCRMEFDPGGKNVKKHFQLASIIDVYKGEIARRLELEKQCPQKGQQQQQQQQQQQHQPLQQQQQSQQQEQKPVAVSRWNFIQKLKKRQPKDQPVLTLKQPVGRRRPPPPPPTEASRIRYPTTLRPPPLPPRPAQTELDPSLSQISLNQQLAVLQIPSTPSPQIPENNQELIDLTLDISQTPEIPEDKHQHNNLSPDPTVLRLPLPIDEPGIPVLISPTAPIMEFSEDTNQSTMASCVDVSGDANQVLCVTCERTPMNPATTRCSNCAMDFCGTCLGSFHPQSDTKTHDVKPLRVIQTDEKCVLCENSKWTVFCMECDILFCQDCQLGHHPAELNHWIHRAKAAQRSVSMISSPTEAKPPIPSRPNSVATPMATPEVTPQTTLDSACICCSKPAFAHCLDCEESLCEDCAKLRHDANTNHTFIKMDKSNSKKPEDIEKFVQMGMLKVMLLKQALLVELTSRMNTDSIDV